MCYNARMSHVFLLLGALAPVLLLARPPVPAALPPVGAATRLEAAVDGAPAFAELGAREPRRHGLATAWLYRREWNMAKLTGRGLEGHGEAFAVQVLPDAVVIRFR